MANYLSSTGNMRRRHVLGLIALPLFALIGCRPGDKAHGRVTGTFLQLWPEHGSLTSSEWNRRFSLLHELGYRDIILQWVAKEGGVSDWELPTSALDNIFDAAHNHGFGIQVGLPHDDRWTTVLRSTDHDDTLAFFDSTRRNILHYIGSSKAPYHSAFRGWYIPYEIEQNSWADTSRRTMLIRWLSELGTLLQKHTASPPTISTYYSRLTSSITLDNLWREILNSASLRPMIQDGVGVAGLENYRNLEPLRKLFIERNIKWDLIIELFEELPSGNKDGTTFRAQTAAYSTIRKQLEIARHYGAQSNFAFAADPWLIGSNSRAKALMKRWKQGM